MYEGKMHRLPLAHALVSSVRLGTRLPMPNLVPIPSTDWCWGRGRASPIHDPSAPASAAEALGAGSAASELHCQVRSCIYKARLHILKHYYIQCQTLTV